MKKVTINKMDFELAFELSDFESSGYLDTETGTVVIVEDYTLTELEKYVDEDAELAAIVEKIKSDEILDEAELEIPIAVAEVEYGDDIAQYRLIPKQDSREGYRDMQEYIWSLDDESLVEQLSDAIHGSGAFRRFKGILGKYPESLENWFKFRDHREHQRMMDWFKSINIEPIFE